MNIALLSSGFVAARLFTGRPVIILGFRNVHVKVRKPQPGEIDPPQDWIGPALWLEFKDGTRHHGYAPETVVELIQAYFSIGQARAALKALSE
jgi:hypothetical protein